MQIILSPRESQVIRLTARGFSAKEIAHSLQLTVKTVGVHRFNAMKKAQVHSTIELVLGAIRSGEIKITELPKMDVRLT